MTDTTPAPEGAAPLTDDERETVRTSALGAMALVSQADPGFFATFKESMAGSKALAAAPPEIRELLTGGLTMPPTGSSPEEVEQKILSGVTSAMGILRAKAPGQADGYRDVLLQACDAVAKASKGVAPEEQAAIEKVRSALDAGAGSDGTAPAPPA